VLQHFYGLFPRNAREILKKLGERATTFQVVEQGLHGNTGAAKDWGTPQDLGIRENLGAGAAHRQKCSALIRDSLRGTSPGRVLGCGITDQALSCGRQRL